MEVTERIRFVDKQQRFAFRYDDTIRIKIPVLYVPYDELDEEEINKIHQLCDEISGEIPALIHQFEKEYEHLYEELAQGDTDEVFYKVTDRLNEISRNISELNICYYRMQGKFLNSAAHG
jgi:pyruvate-formate lyase-activating enzyme